MSHPPDDHKTPGRIKTGLAGLVWRITPNCKEVARLTSEERDRALPPGLRARLGLHRVFCQWCARYAEQLDLLHTASRSFPEHLDEAGGPKMNADAKARLKRALREQSNGEPWHPQSD